MFQLFIYEKMKEKEEKKIQDNLSDGESPG